MYKSFKTRKLLQCGVNIDHNAFIRSLYRTNYLCATSQFNCIYKYYACCYVFNMVNIMHNIRKIYCTKQKKRQTKEIDNFPVEKSNTSIVVCKDNIIDTVTLLIR